MVVPLHASKQHERFLTIEKLAIAAVLVTFLTTAKVVSDLHSQISVNNQRNVVHSSASSGNWREVAGRAVGHVEHISHLRSDHKEPVSTISEPVKREPQIPLPVEKAGPEKDTSSSSSVAVDYGKCSSLAHTEFWGEVVSMKVFKTSAECCRACQEAQPTDPNALNCNVWVYCDDKDLCKEKHGECWLKHLANPLSTKPAAQGPEVGWASGVLDSMPVNDKPTTTGSRQYHVITTAQGPAVHWQARVHYYWYKKVKARCEAEGPCDMGGFTRLLHSGEPDDLIDEIPTVVVDPLPDSVVVHHDYPVLNRPYAFVEWLKKMDIPEKYIFMSEPDHIFIRPLPNLMVGETPAAFPFFYIAPSAKENADVTRMFVGNLPVRELEKIAPMGNSPTFLSLETMRKVAPIWLNTSIAIYKSEAAKKAWGWVQEMYAFSFAVYLAGDHNTVSLHLDLMAQPPFDTLMHLDHHPDKPFYLLHYTYGMDYTLQGVFTPGKFGEWRFDKRSYIGTPPPRNLEQPPQGMKNDLVRFLINAINEASAAIPCWDEYVKTGKVAKC